MKILITGSSGMLGSDLIRVFKKFSRLQLIPTSKTELDIQDWPQTNKFITSHQPDLIIHLGALTNLDYCEEHPNEAFRVNAYGTKNIALAANAVNAQIVYLSTDGVYDGKKGSEYYEYDAPNPISIYGQSKLEGEKWILGFSSRFFIIRAGWMFGGSTKDKKFVAKILKIGQQEGEIKAVTDKVGSPIYTIDLASKILELIQTSAYGIYHLVNEGGCSRYELAQEIFKNTNLNVKIIPATSDEFPMPAPRPDKTPLKNFALENLGLAKMPTWEDAIKRYVKRLCPVPEKVK